jgi:hypothetical protein
MAIHFHNSKTRLPEALKLSASIATYMFEQEYGEMEFLTETDKKLLKRAGEMLAKKANKWIKK